MSLPCNYPSLSPPRHSAWAIWRKPSANGKVLHPAGSSSSDVTSDLAMVAAALAFESAFGENAWWTRMDAYARWPSLAVFTDAGRRAVALLSPPPRCRFYISIFTCTRRLVDA
jgi:hypothetical protein